MICGGCGFFRVFGRSLRVGWICLLLVCVVLDIVVGVWCDKKVVVSSL